MAKHNAAFAARKAFKRIKAGKMPALPGNLAKLSPKFEEKANNLYVKDKHRAENDS